MAVKLDTNRSYQGIVIDYLKQKFPDLSGIVQSNQDCCVEILFKDGCKYIFGGLRSTTFSESLEIFISNHKKDCEIKP